MSIIAQRITGTFLEDEKPQREAVPQWVQQQLRSPSFRRALESFAVAQPEPLNIDLVQLEAIKPGALVCRVPCYVTDHESTHPFRGDVLFELNPLTGQALRRIGD